MKPEEPSIEVEHLTIGYKAKRKETIIASNISFAANKGELIAIVGANGIGKSTLLRTLMAMQPSLSGNIYIKRENLDQLNYETIARYMSVVLTEPIASKNLSVYELIALGRHPYTNWLGELSKTDKIIIANALEQTEIRNLQDKKCYQLSDGQLQRVMIARALAQDTDIIVLDEPTTHLDMYHKAYVLNLLKDIAVQSNKCILFSSHEIDLAIQLCHKMLVMTENEQFYESPDKLINEGIFDKLFPKSLIQFDADKRGFSIIKK